MEKLKILIAEDDKDLMALYDKALPDKVFDKTLVVDGEKASEAYKNWHPDILVLDLLMPVKTGFMVLQEIRGEIKDMDTTIIVSSSIDDMDEVRECEKLGIQGYIVKPFNFKKVAGEILEFFKKTNPQKASQALIQLQKA